MKRQFLILIVLSVFITGHSQSIFQPNYGLKSHETLEISKIESTSKATSFYMSIENRIQGGSFCADKNIFIIYPDESRTKLISAGGIPVCPESYKFKTIGEKLDFTLTFPELKPGIEWIDLVEECSENCFSFYGITLNIELNTRLEEAFNLASTQTSAENINLFKTILDSIDSKNLGIEGLLYINIIDAAIEEADKVSTIVWYKRLASSNAPRLSQYLKYLNDKGIKY